MRRTELHALYESVGRQKGLDAILRDFYRRMSRDALIGYFFDGKDPDAIAAKQRDFLMRAMGARKTYSGKTPARAHRNLPPILRGHFDRRLRILEETLRSHGVADEDIRTWVAYEETFRPVIVVSEGSPERSDSRRSRPARALAFVVLSLAVGVGTARLTAADESEPAPGAPAWYVHKKTVEKEKAKEAEKKAREKPAVGGSGEGAQQDQEPTFSELSKANPPPPSPNLLFDKRGLTDSMNLDYGDLIQPEINGLVLGAQYGMGWWWASNLVLSAFARVDGALAPDYLWVMVGGGPQLRYFTKRHWTFTANLAWMVSKGLSRVPTSHIPTPPDATMLAARDGPAAGFQIAYLFWSKRDLAVGPALNLWVGQQTDRAFATVSLGVTFQSGRPDYGSVADPFFSTY